MPKKILVVDDDPDVLETVKLLIELLGYETLTADDGSTGLETAMTNGPDAVLTDFNMPHNGLWLAKALRERNYSKPVLMITSDVDMRPTGISYSQKFRETLTRYGIDESRLPEYVTAFVSKPPGIDDIRLVLSQYAPQQQ